MGRRRKHHDEDDESSEEEDSDDSDANGKVEDGEEVDLKWIGKGVPGHPRNPKSKSQNVRKYEAVEIKIGSSGEFVCGVGDYVHLRTGQDYGEPFVGRVMDLYEDSKGYKLGTVQWLYRPADVSVSSVRAKADSDEILYAAEHLDRIAVETIIETFRIEFSVQAGDKTVTYKSKLYADKERDDTDVCLYRCSRIYDLVSRVTPLTEEQYKQIEKDPYIKIDESGDSRSERDREKQDATNLKKRGRPSKKSSSNPNQVIELSSGDEASISSSKRSNPEERKHTRRSGATELVELFDNRRGRNQKEASHPSKKKRAPLRDDGSERDDSEDDTFEEELKRRKLSKKRARVVEDSNFTSHPPNDKSLSALGASATKPPKENVIVTDLDEKLWDSFQQARNELGTEDALEVLGYIKLEYLVDNEQRMHSERICPPTYIRAKINIAAIALILAKLSQLLGRKISRGQDDNPGGIARSFQELEKLRPGTVFKLLGHGTSKGTWLFPSSFSTPIFGSLLGLDGFQTCKMMYHKQALYIPIDREGSVSQAAVRGFSRLVQPDFSFTLIRTGDFFFEIAPSPDEKFEQFFVKMPNGRTISVYVPLKKARVSFIKAFVCANEKLLPSQLRLTVGDRTVGDTPSDDDLLLPQLPVRSLATIQITIKI